ncbi:hypothetical protein [Nocardiopsis trehalosi]|jgi:hypothetical protein|uniref:hypothetical protein n=1 Tax=Nocardiopsis trehalosi TaxID=109329 RepID=UPI00082D90D6|nr:hypothetical protein [Nocardiopsis trehalosi]
MDGDLLGPTGPTESLRGETPPTVYRPAPDASPHRLRRGPDQEVYGWVRMVPVGDAEPAPCPHEEVLLQADNVRASIGDGLAAPAARGDRPRAIEDLEGYEQRPNPLDAHTPAQFVEAMQRFRVWSGEWSLRQLERYCGGAVSRSTFHTTLANTRELPKFVVLCAFISACGGGEDEIQRWVTAWRRLRMPEEEEQALLRLRTWSTL